MPGTDAFIEIENASGLVSEGNDPCQQAARLRELMAVHTRVLVAMSGGVDSSVAALLCARRAGLEVIGVTLKLYDASGSRASIGGRCCSPRDIADARSVAHHLGIAHYVIDEVAAFQGAVIDDFVAEYRAGRTPNPCVRCNERIKFGPLLAFADALGAAGLVTGHYARLRHDGGGTRLLRARDRDKDQSYFLFGVRPDILARVEFPLGDLHKEEVRALARSAGLPNADKPDSTEICFVPEGDHKAFVSARGGAGRAGVILDESGAVLGQHAGTHHYTFGQRRSVPARDGQARFVVHIDAFTGTVYTAPRAALVRNELWLDDVRWMTGRAPRSGTACSAQLRHRGTLHAAQIHPGQGSEARLVFDRPTEGVAPGQVAVLYEGDAVLGGGWVRANPIPVSSFFTRHSRARDAKAPVIGPLRGARVESSAAANGPDRALTPGCAPPLVKEGT